MAFNSPYPPLIATTKLVYREQSIKHRKGKSAFESALPFLPPNTKKADQKKSAFCILFSLQKMTEIS